MIGNKHLPGRYVPGLYAVLLGLTVFAGPVAAETLSGVVSSDKEGAMEGVLVNAKEQGGNIKVTVVSDAQGRYRFPDDRLASGTYDITVRAVRYKLSPTTINIRSGRDTALDLKLTEITDPLELGQQLSGTEWMLSAGKEGIRLGGCVNCHTLQRVMYSQYNAEQMARVVQRMSVHTNNSSPLRPWVDTDAAEKLARPLTEDQIELGKYIASINLSAREVWPFELKTLPRPKGDDTKVIYTTYELPRPEAAPHDEGLDGNGNIWYSDFNTPYIGMVNTGTGEVKDYKIPLRRPNGVAQGGLQLDIDPEGNIWYATMEQIQIVRFDPETEKMDIFDLPVAEEDADDAHTTMIDTSRMGVDGNIWFNVAGGGEKGGEGAWRFHVASQEFTKITYPPGSPRAQAYDLSADSQNNVWGHTIRNHNLWTTNAKTLETEWFPLPDNRVGCRRGHMDSHDRLWCADWQGNGVVMFNTRTRKFEGNWTMPTPIMRPYDAHYDEETYVWAGGMDSDLVVRLNVKTNEFNEYLVPLRTNMRSIHMQPGGPNELSSLWIGNQHGAAITHVEPLEPVNQAQTSN